MSSLIPKIYSSQCSSEQVSLMINALPVDTFVYWDSIYDCEIEKGISDKLRDTIGGIVNARFFNENFELRFKRMHDVYRVVVISDILAPELLSTPGFCQNGEDLKFLSSHKNYLWGELDTTLEEYPVWLEARIPRLLYYPVPDPKGSRIMIQINNYALKTNPRNLLTRFVSLSEAED